MPGLHDTLARLKTLKIVTSAMGGQGPDRLGTLEDFGSNPGGLTARCYVPADLGRGAPLVVVLHGCTQNAAGYDHAAGWSRAADRHGFAVLFPEQVRANNPNLCFNWFSPADIARDGGEAYSIRQMIDAMQASHATDPSRVFVTGLSAGGAMAAVMLATYPEIFAGGTIIAGLPYGVANSVPSALERMRGSWLPGEAELTRLVREAAPTPNRWPMLSVWHGSADSTVVPANGEALIDQWRGLHDLKPTPDRTVKNSKVTRQSWLGADGSVVVEHVTIAGLGHGTPIDSTAAGSDEHSAPHMLEAGISATRDMIAAWGIAGEKVRSSVKAEAASASKAESAPATAQNSIAPRPSMGAPVPPRRAVPKARILHPTRAKTAKAVDPITRTIESALRKAGLMR
jgi:poly(hydroxyalkanoate) depolymerase family esterase